MDKEDFVMTSLACRVKEINHVRSILEDDDQTKATIKEYIRQGEVAYKLTKEILKEMYD